MLNGAVRAMSAACFCIEPTTRARIEDSRARTNRATACGYPCRLLLTSNGLRFCRDRDRRTVCTGNRTQSCFSVAQEAFCEQLLFAGSVRGSADERFFRETNSGLLCTRSGFETHKRREDTIHKCFSERARSGGDSDVAEHRTRAEYRFRYASSPASNLAGQPQSRLRPGTSLRYSRPHARPPGDYRAVRSPFLRSYV